MCGSAELLESTAEESRVGTEVYYVEDVKVGETVSFHYDAGSEPGGERTVTVLKIDGYGALEGSTKERGGEYRRYLSEHIEGPILIVSEAKSADAGNTRRVRFDEAGEALLASLSGEQLAELYAQHVAVAGDGAEFDPQTGDVVVYLPAPQNRVSRVNNGQVVLSNKDGQEFKLWLHSQYGRIGVDNDKTDFHDTDVSPEVLRDELVKFLS